MDCTTACRLSSICHADFLPQRIVALPCLLPRTHCCAAVWHACRICHPRRAAVCLARTRWHPHKNFTSCHAGIQPLKLWRTCRNSREVSEPHLGLKVIQSCCCCHDDAARERRPTPALARGCPLHDRSSGKLAAWSCKVVTWQRPEGVSTSVGGDASGGNARAGLDCHGGVAL